MRLKIQVLALFVLISAGFVQAGTDCGPTLVGTIGGQPRVLAAGDDEVFVFMSDGEIFRYAVTADSRLEEITRFGSLPLPPGFVRRLPDLAGVEGNRLWVVNELWVSEFSSFNGEIEFVLYDVSVATPTVLYVLRVPLVEPGAFGPTKVLADADHVYVASGERIELYKLLSADTDPPVAVIDVSHFSDLFAAADGISLFFDFWETRVLDARGLPDGVPPSVAGSVDALLDERFAYHDGVFYAHSYSPFGQSRGAIDASDPANPVLLGNLDAEGPYGPEGPYDIAVEDGVAAIVRRNVENERYYTLEVYNSITPSDLDPLGSLCLNCREQGFIFGSESLQDRLTIVGETAIANAYGLMSVDLSDRSDPRIVDRLHGTAFGLAVQTKGDLAFIANSNYGFSIWNIAALDRPVPLSSVLTPGDANGLFLDADTLYVSVRGLGIEIYDVSLPESPTKLGTVPTIANSNDVLPIPNGLAVTTDDGIELFSGDPDTGYTARGAVRADGGGVAGDLVFRDDLLYASMRPLGLWIIDAGDLDHPTVMGTSVPDGAEPFGGLTIHGETAYLGLRNGIGIIDITDPSSPESRGIRGAGVGTLKLAVSEDLLFGVGLFNPLSIYSIAEPTQPRLIWTAGSDPATPPAERIQSTELWIEGDRLVVTEGGADASVGRGLTIWELPESCDIPCSDADLAAPAGVIDLADIAAFVESFTGQTVRTDYAEPFGVWDLADITVFVESFSAGCP